MNLDEVSFTREEDIEAVGDGVLSYEYIEYIEGDFIE